MVSVETISIVFTGLSVSLAAFYYMSTLRNAQRTQRLALESRQTQIFMQIFQQMNTEESNKTWAETMNLEYTDYDDFLRKYDSSVNPDSFGKRSHIWWCYNAMGVLLEEGLINPDMVYRLMGVLAVMQWQKWSGVIKEFRKQENIPDALAGFEYLYTEMKKILDEKEYPEPAYGQPFIQRPELKT